MLSKQKVLTLGFQHVLAMYAGAVIVPLIVGGALKLSGSQMAYLIAADLFTCGIATILQVIGTKYFGGPTAGDSGVYLYRGRADHRRRLRFEFGDRLWSNHFIGIIRYFGSLRCMEEC
ncbi:hypothetical protein LJK88_24150 [Paenibacillus sp. P26]|nr:hypothetical protein LJK88_24150 [Paenibacillus sp. P26]